MDTINARNLKFGMYLPCTTLHKSDVAILKILLFGLLWPPKGQKSNMAAIFEHIFAHKMPKIQNSQYRYIRFVKHHTMKVNAKFHDVWCRKGFLHVTLFFEPIFNCKQQFRLLNAEVWMTKM